ncbi:BNR repeat-containing glycosyl hydrolase [Burkholderia anthina]|uniref:BNR repeat-containing glycosyl hydrolase n=2 Tax=Burkholderia anthina TaxID=179879 RepID=A0A6P2G1H9_9BURK|nr:BNR repeat-containing glycosyl hydrolase [Burkholderia anthina]
MQKHKRWKWIAGGLVALAIGTYGYVNMATGWETISTNFMRNDTPYGGGNFRIKGNDVMSVKLANPEVTFKPTAESNEPQRPEPTEAWMNDTGELLNRMTISFFRGTIDGGMKRQFQQVGQNAAWWYSPDWSVQFLSTSWMNYKAPEARGGDAPQTTKLWKSLNGGQTWSQLQWPDSQNIGQLLFLDPQRGYAIGWGPRVWRTADGGTTWQAIDVPADAHVAGKTRKNFNAVSLGPDGVLRIAYSVAPTAETPARSMIDRLDWEQHAFVTDTELPGQVVTALDTTPGPAARYSLYALSRLDKPQNGEVRDNGRRTGAISTWTNDHPESVHQLRTFDETLRLDSLSVGRGGLLLVYATDPNSGGRGGAPIDLTFSSTDAGKSWDQATDKVAQGGYFDAQTNTLYWLHAFTLKKRTF